MSAATDAERQAAYCADLAAVVRRRQALEDEIRLTVSAARAAGLTWAQLGAALGVTRQAAQLRYGR